VAKAATPAAPTAKAPVAPKEAAPDMGSRNERTEPLSRMRITIAKRLKTAQNTAAMLTTFNEIDMSALMALRGKHKDEFLERHGAKLGFMSAFVKASSYALQRSPAVNGFFDEANKQIVYRDYVDVSIAVSTPTGLVVPVLRNTHTMNFHQVESTIAAFGAKARKGQIAMEDMAGGTFTISNGGVYGSLFGTPILNPPQSAVLGMHGIFKRPVAIGDKVEIRPMMYVALTYDHRIIDGKDGVTFLVDIKNAIENPERMLLNL
jgi:2-oxoglutarate dehydrogenase E2 component (dihydrolipoamide succinyltransferase)